MSAPDREARQIERTLKPWFPPRAFIKAAPIGDCPVLPEERALVANAVRRRKNEFATGRWLSRQGLQSFGLPDAPIGTGRLRNPLWPETVLGTITHDGELCAVALMQKQPHAEAGIGIDLVSLSQRAGRMEKLAPMFVADAAEIGTVETAGLRADPALLLFSLKEAVIKAMSFRLHDFVDMREIEILDFEASKVRMFGEPVRTVLFAATTEDYLVTAARAY